MITLINFCGIIHQNDEKVTINLSAIIHSAAEHTLWHTGKPAGRHHAGGGRRKKQQEVRRNIIEGFFQKLENILRKNILDLCYTGTGIIKKLMS